jgi:glutamate dehydrogenase (NADP+)
MIRWKVVTISGPDGYIYDEEGISGDKIDFMLENARGDNRAEAYLEKYPKAQSTRGKSKKLLLFLCYSK